MERAQVSVDVVSDVVCPWCYIGKRRLESARDLLPDLDLDVRWHPFQLAPDIPREGITRDAYLVAKFGSVERMKASFQRVAEIGHDVGLKLDFERITRSPNTLDAHRLIHWAGGAGIQDAVVEGLFEAYFTDGRDLSDRPTLVSLAEDAGLDAAVVSELLSTDRDEDVIRAQVARAHQVGISGVPFFIIGQTHAVSGAEAAETLAAAVRQHVAERRSKVGQPMN